MKMELLGIRDFIVILYNLIDTAKLRKMTIISEATRCTVKTLRLMDILRSIQVNRWRKI